MDICVWDELLFTYNQSCENFSLAHCIFCADFDVLDCMVESEFISQPVYSSFESIYLTVFHRLSINIAESAGVSQE